MLAELIKPRLRLIQQEQQIKRLQQELASLREQNNSMRDGMRRCVSCTYRIDAKQRQDQRLEGHNPLPNSSGESP